MFRPLLLVVVISFPSLSYCDTVLEDYLGHGYDVVMGNPVFYFPGEILDDDASDPGLRKSILKAARTVPVEVEVGGRTKCKSGSVFTIVPSTFRRRIVNEMFINPQSWHTVLKDNAIIGDKKARQAFPSHTVIMDDYNMCVADKVYTNTELGLEEVTDEFMHDVCRLPRKMDADKSKQFFLKFGTSVVTSLQTGSVVLARYETSHQEMNGLSEAISQGEPRLHYNQESVSRTYVHITDKVVGLLDKARMRHSFQRSAHWQIGVRNGPAVVRVGLTNIDELVDERFWPLCKGDKANELWNGYADCCQRLPQIGELLVESLNKYPEQLKVLNPDAGLDPDYRLYWPIGNYTMVRTVQGCPGWTRFKWHLGVVTHSQGPYSHVTSSEAILPAAFSEEMTIGTTYQRVRVDVVHQRFCTKTESDANKERPWPAGSYCIHKKGDCPAGFEEGWIYFDDTHLRNGNDLEGIVPDGIYDNQNTQMFYCCRDDAPPTKAIVLPVHRPFILIRHGGECQTVKWTRLVEGSVYFDAAWGTAGYPNSYFMGGKHPDDIMSGANNKLYYCYYTYADAGGE